MSEQETEGTETIFKKFNMKTNLGKAETKGVKIPCEGKIMWNCLDSRKRKLRESNETVT